MKRWCVLALCLFLPSVAEAAGPDVRLQDLQGQERTAGEFIGKGKWTVVAVWAHDCLICNQEIHHMVFFHDAHHQKDAVVLGVSIDGPAQRAKAQQFVDRHGLNFPNLLGTRAEISGFGGRVVGTPTYYVYSPEGILVSQKLGATTQEEVEEIIYKKSKEKERHNKG